MSVVPPVVLILGAGPRIGAAVGRHFAASGFKVAFASRSASAANNTDTQLHIPSDFTRVEDIASAFAKVRATFGIPSVVVYNASAVTFAPHDDPLSIPYEGFSRDQLVNVHSAFIAAKHAVEGFADLPPTASRTFLYTGNITDTTYLPGFISQAIGKSGAAAMIRDAAEAYKDKGYKFYYVDERKSDGSAKFKVDAQAHAEIFLQLANSTAQGPWSQTFVAGTGYVHFA